MQSSISDNRGGNCLKIIQHNANRQSAAQISVLQQAFEEGTHVVLFQEPSCTKTFHFVSHPAFQRIEPLQDPSKYATARPRTMAYFRRSFPYDFSPRFDICEDPDLQLFEIYAPEPFFLVHIYNERRDHGGYATKTSDALRALRLTKPALFTGDFNLYHP